MIFLMLVSLFGPYHADVVRVIDGDTVEVMAEVFPGAFQKFGLRLDGVNAPETRTLNLCEKKAGLKVKHYVESIIPKQVIITNIHKGKFAGRMIGGILINNKDLADMLLEKGLVRKYDGGKRKQWCLQK